MSKRKRWRSAIIHWYHPVKQWYKPFPGTSEPCEYKIWNAACYADHIKTKTSSLIEDITCDRCRLLFIDAGGQHSPKTITLSDYSHELGPQSRHNMERIKLGLYDAVDALLDINVNGIKLSEEGLQILSAAGYKEREDKPGYVAY